MEAMTDLFVTVIAVPKCGQSHEQHTQHIILEQLDIHSLKKESRHKGSPKLIQSRSQM